MNANPKKMNSTGFFCLMCIKILTTVIVRLNTGIEFYPNSFFDNPVLSLVDDVLDRMKNVCACCAGYTPIGQLDTEDGLVRGPLAPPSREHCEVTPLLLSKMPFSEEQFYRNIYHILEDPRVFNVSEHFFVVPVIYFIFL
jgi:hypothetical protein